MYRHDTFDFSRCLYVVNSAQSLHFKQVFKVIELAGYDYHKGLVHVSFGWIRFADRAMSTREGYIVFLEEVISKAKEFAREIILEKNPDIEGVDQTAQDIGVGAVVFAQLSVRRVKDIDFRWEDALSFDGETGPYLQYTHARLCSLNRKYGKDMPDQIDFGQFGQPEEKNILVMLAQYPEKVELAAREYEPFVISSYLIDLAQEFNTFYQKHRIVTDNAPLTDARMVLADSVRVVLSDGLRILGLTPLERM
jgi:arginyl-tRNA synthetase